MSTLRFTPAASTADSKESSLIPDRISITPDAYYLAVNSICDREERDNPTLTNTNSNTPYKLR